MLYDTHLYETIYFETVCDGVSSWSLVCGGNLNRLFSLSHKSKTPHLFANFADTRGPSLALVRKR